MDFRHYAICDSCALSNLAEPPKWACTISMGKCPYCKQEDVVLIPTSDFKWPWDSVASHAARWD